MAFVLFTDSMNGMAAHNESDARPWPSQTQVLWVMRGTWVNLVLVRYVFHTRQPLSWLDAQGSDGHWNDTSMSQD